MSFEYFGGKLAAPPPGSFARFCLFESVRRYSLLDFTVSYNFLCHPLHTFKRIKEINHKTRRVRNNKLLPRLDLVCAAARAAFPSCSFSGGHVNQNQHKYS